MRGMGLGMGIALSITSGNQASTKGTEMGYKENHDLSKITDQSLNALVVACVARGVDFDEIEKLAGTSYVVGRKAFRYANAAIYLYTRQSSADPQERSNIEVTLFNQLDRLLVTT